MSYRTKWYDHQECVAVARDLSTADLRVFGIELEDIGGNGVRMNGGYGANIEDKAMAMGLDRGAVRLALGVDDSGRWLGDDGCQ